MSKLESLKQEIRKLSPQELAELVTWLQEYDAELWDRQFEEDVRAGRLDRLAKKALESYHAGRKFGLDQGKIVIRADFDEPLQDLEQGLFGSQL